MRVEIVDEQDFPAYASRQFSNHNAMKDFLTMFMFMFLLCFIIFTCLGCYMNYGGVYTFSNPWNMFVKDMGLRLIFSSLAAIILAGKVMENNKGLN